MIRKIECENCRGIGTEICPKCNGNEKDYDGNTCSYCAGMGITICQKCGGNGYIEIEVNDEYANMGW